MDDSGSPLALYSSDGTASGTVKLTDLSFEGWIAYVGNLNGRLLMYYAGEKTLELWSTDGSPEGTTRLAERGFVLE
jgi:hypothetical protein